jgi:hypothetical protein
VGVIRAYLLLLEIDFFAFQFSLMPPREGPVTFDLEGNLIRVQSFVWKRPTKTLPVIKVIEEPKAVATKPAIIRIKPPNPPPPLESTFEPFSTTDIFANIVVSPGVTITTSDGKILRAN